MRVWNTSLRGSLTVEAAWVMAVALLAVAVMLHEGGRIHDETKGAMTLHEAVEKGRHERYLDIEGIGSEAEENMGLRMSFSSYQLSLNRWLGKVTGEAKGGVWSREIEIREFRPERFMRQITLIESLRDGYENKLPTRDKAQLSGSGAGK